MKRYALHPPLIAAYAVLALLAHNISQVKLGDGLRPLLAALGLACLVWAGLRLVYGSWGRAAPGAALLLVLFFSYGHVYHYLEASSGLGRHRLLLPLWIGLAAVGLWLVARLKNPSETNFALNVIALALLALPLIQIAAFQGRSALNQANEPTPILEGAHLSLPENPPDIYYIVLDAYARQDYLIHTFNFDNAGFVAELRELGFYVADCSQSNYAQTELAFSSTLNMDYLTELGVPLKPYSTDRSPLYALIKHSTVRSLLESLGYTTIAFDSGFYRTQIDDAEIYLTPQSSVLEGVKGFERLLVETSAGLLISDASLALPGLLVPNVEDLEHQRHRELVLYELEQLPKVPEIDSGPKFVIVHILSPHDPYVFGPQGERVYYTGKLNRQREIRAYRDQVEFLNSQILPALKALIEKSETPPVIIIQGDHGSGVDSDQGRLSIFNAYYLPGADQIPPAGSSREPVRGRTLYPWISPVNSFRVVFNTVFGARLPMLEDRSSFSAYESPYNFYNIPAGPESCPE